jgi:hypothetical protein
MQGAYWYMEACINKNTTLPQSPLPSLPPFTIGKATRAHPTLAVFSLHLP